MSKKTHIIILSDEERSYLESYISKGVHSSRSIKRARVLLQASLGATDKAIAIDVGYKAPSSIYNIRRRFCTEGLEFTLKDKPRSGRPVKFSGRDEAHITAIACSKAPDGRVRWTLRLLADRVVDLEIVDSTSHVTVGNVLKKSDLKPWQKEQWCIGDINSLFIMRMEDVLDVYELPYDPLRPVICFDEKPFQLLGDTIVPIEMKPGKKYRYDHHYERKGVCNIFIAVEPLTGWRFAKVTDRRTKIDYAHFMKEVADKHFPDRQITLVQDNLNTHNASSFYEAFTPEEGHRLKNRFQYHYTPVNGSWLNMAEIELSALSRQCLKNRIPQKEMVASQLEPWVKERIEKEIKINWRFTTDKAREKFSKKYDKLLKTF